MVTKNGRPDAVSREPAVLTAVARVLLAEAKARATRKEAA
jgi:hypothetical protein